MYQKTVDKGLWICLTNEPGETTVRVWLDVMELLVFLMLDATIPLYEQVE